MLSSGHVRHGSQIVLDVAVQLAIVKVTLGSHTEQLLQILSYVRPHGHASHMLGSAEQLVHVAQTRLLHEVQGATSVVTPSSHAEQFRHTVSCVALHCEYW